jgi:hypothetical protein
MSEFEELRINVKTDPEKASENARQLQDAFRQIGGTQQTEQFEKLGRQLKLTEKQLKDLGEAVAKPQSTLQAFAIGFGKAGMIMGAFGVAIKAAQMAADQFNKVASRHVEIQNQANRMGGIHAAQLDADIKAMERNSIERGRSAAMIEKFNEKVQDFKDKATGFRRSILADIQGPFVEVVEQHFDELKKAPNLEEWMNLVRRFAAEIDKYYTERGDPQRGAAERRKYLEKWFGLPDIMQMNEDFKQVSEDVKKEWDEQQQVLTEYVRVTAEISDNWEKILSGIVHATLEDLGINKGLVMLNDLLERGAREHTDWGAMTAEQRREYADKLREAGDKYWREHGVIDFLKHLWNDPDFAKKLVPLPPIEKEGHATHLLENFNDNASDLVLESRRLTQNIAFLNSMLSGETNIVGGGDARSKFATMFHNRPQGGARGESNPIRLPASVPQPGGGSAAEARDFQASKSTIYYTAPTGSKVAKYTDPHTGESYSDYTKPIGPPSSGLPSETPGIAFGYRNFPKHGRETLGGYYLVTPKEGQGAGQSFILPHSDIGPGAGHGEKLDYNAPAAQMVFGSMKESVIQGGSYLHYIGKDLPEGVSPGRQSPFEDVSSKYGLSGAHSKFIQEQMAAREAISSGPQEGASTGKRLDPSGNDRLAQYYTGEEAFPKLGMRMTGDDAWQSWRRSTENENIGFEKAGWRNQFPQQSGPGLIGPHGPTDQFETFKQSQEYMKRANLPEESFGPLAQQAGIGGRFITTPSGQEFGDTAGVADEPEGAWHPENFKTFPGGGEADTTQSIDRGRNQIDRVLSDQIDVRGKLNVKVDAPAGTSVRAKGTGMFEKGVTLDRGIQANAGI